MFSLASLLASLLSFLKSFFPKSISINSNKYTVNRTISEGASAYVLLATLGNNKYAVKQIPICLPEHIPRIHDEIKHLQSISHPNVIRLIDHQLLYKNNTLFEARLLFPYYERSLQSIIDTHKQKNEPFQLHVVLRISLDICSALIAFHSLEPPLAFRDLKPANVLIDNSGKAILTDLGSVALAKVTLASRQDALVLSELCAETVTAPFRAPELFDPPSNATLSTDLSDIWALGCTIFNIAYLEPPFDGTMTATVSGNIPFPASDPYGPQLKSLIQSLLVIKASSRPSSVQSKQLISRLLTSVTIDV